MKGVFITGTGTGVGKTHITGLLLGLLRQRGVEAVSLKPIQTGCAAGEESPDLLEHWHLAGWHPTPEVAARCCPVRLTYPASPHLAASMEGVELKLSEIIIKIQKEIQNNQFSLIEGAGGVLVPLNEQETMLDLMIGLQLPVIVVAAAGLGTINHTLLTVNELQRAGLSILAVVLSVQPGEAGELVDSNRDTLAQRTGLPVITQDMLPAIADTLTANLGQDVP